MYTWNYTHAQNMYYLADLKNLRLVKAITFRRYFANLQSHQKKIVNIDSIDSIFLIIRIMIMYPTIYPTDCDRTEARVYIYSMYLYLYIHNQFKVRYICTYAYIHVCICVCMNISYTYTYPCILKDISLY